jgi:hypothetical protein
VQISRMSGSITQNPVEQGSGACQKFDGVPLASSAYPKAPQAISDSAIPRDPELVPHAVTRTPKEPKAIVQKT